MSMFGERPVPLGTQGCSSDRNQYLETGELNDEEVRTQSVLSGAGPPAHVHGHNDQHHSMQMQETRNSILVGSSSGSGNGLRHRDPEGFERNPRDAYNRRDEDGSSGEDILSRAVGRGMSPDDSEIDTVESGRELNNGNGNVEDSDEKAESGSAIAKAKLAQGNRRQREKQAPREVNPRDGPAPPSLRSRKTNDDRERERYRSSRASGVPHRDRDRDRDWDRDSQSNRYYGGRGGGYPDEDESYSGRPWSRNDYYGREREMPDYYRRQRDPYYDEYYRHGRDEFDHSRRYERGGPRGWDYADVSRHESFNSSRGFAAPVHNTNPNSREILDYLENLRVKDRITYRKWYEKYMIHLKNPTQIPFPVPPGYIAAGVYPSSGPAQSNYRPGHASGRSSVNKGEFQRSNSFTSNTSGLGNAGNYDQDYQSMPPELFKPIGSKESEESSSRSTPQKFLSGHSLGVLNPLGQLLRVTNGGTVVEVNNLKQLMMHLPEYAEIESFAGPLVKGKTYKNNVIKFCQKKIKEAQLNPAQVDRENFILIWELLILLLRQNGSVVGSDIAELLLKKNAESSNHIAAGEDEETENAINGEVSPGENIKNTQKFCDLLLYGNKMDAIEHAISSGLWGHALFLASKMGEKEYGHVMARFANGLPLNHPLQTLYQIMSGKQPSSVTCCCDESFGDWRPHLSMILSNSGGRPDLEQKTIVTLGDTLGNGNHAYAAQFCYLMAQLEFSPTSKLGPLLGLSPAKDNIIEATQMTEIYEFARSLAEPNANLGLTFIEYKFDYMKDLVAFGFVQEAFSYCEEVSKQLIHFKKSSQGKLESLKWAVLQISERLQRCEDSEAVGSLNWIQDLKLSLGDSFEAGNRKSSVSSSIEQSSDNQTAANPVVTPYYPEEVQPVLPEDNPDYNPVPPSTQDTTPSYYNPNAGSFGNSNQFTQEQPNPGPVWNSNSYETDQWNGGNMQIPNSSVPEPSVPPSPMKMNPTFSTGNNLYFTPPNVAPGATQYGQQQPPPMPLGNGPIHPPYGHSNAPSNDPGLQNSTYFPNKIPDQQQQHQQPPQQIQQQKKEQKPKPKEAEKKSENKSGGFFGSMFGKWIKEDKTQMKLPDDKNPSIVWDDVKKKWVNVGGDAEEENTATAAPPSDMLLMKMQQSSIPPTAAPAPNLYQQMPLITNNAPPSSNNNNNINNSMRMMPTGVDPSQVPQGPSSLNRYSLPKGRPLKNSYVDVLKPAGIPTGPMPQLPPMFTPAPLDMGDAGPASFVTSSSDVSQGYMPSESDNQAQDSAQSQPMYDHSSFQQGQMYGYGQPNPQ